MKPFSFVAVMLSCVFVGLSGCSSSTSETNPTTGSAKNAAVATQNRPVAPVRAKVITGKVVDIDLSAMFVDGDGILLITSDEGSDVTILIPSGESQPQAAGLDLFPKLKKGDAVEIAGQSVGKDKLRVYLSSHYLKKVVP